MSVDQVNLPAPYSDLLRFTDRKSLDATNLQEAVTPLVTRYIPPEHQALVVDNIVPRWAELYRYDVDDRSSGGALLIELPPGAEDEARDRKVGLLTSAACLFALSAMSTATDKERVDFLFQVHSRVAHHYNLDVRRAFGLTRELLMPYLQVLKDNAETAGDHSPLDRALKIMRKAGIISLMERVRLK